MRLRAYFALFALDLVCIVASFLVAGAIRLGAPLENQTLRTLVVVVPMFVGVALNNRAYSIEALERPAFGATKASEALFYAAAVGIGLLFYLKVSADFSRAIFAVGTALSFTTILAGRAAAVGYVGRKHEWSFANEVVIVDGVAYDRRPGQVVVFARELGIELEADDPVALDRLSRFLQQCDRVILACPPDRRPQWSARLKGTAVDVEILMPELTPLGAMGLRSLNGERTLVVSSRPLNMRDRTIKRALDLAIAGSALLIFAPLMLMVALALKIESRGPALFRQQRVGRNNRLFELLKFRSMRLECADPAGRCSASPSDERVTRVGRFIRRTSLDELPQLLNVVRGDMSIVGPRPHALGSRAGNVLFWQIDSRYFHRHAMKPGITGLAQIRGFRGATVERDDLTSRLHSDLEYLSEWTVWRDIGIILATFRVLVHRNAF